MVFCMALIGAITRLTESGLSMVEWRPLIGALPPLNEAEWQRVYAMYQQSPEFQHKHFWMDLEDFKKIFFWEWLHRLFGRLIGMVYALPLLYFWIRNKIPSGYKGRLLVIFLLGGLQGGMGWYMVKSGLVDHPEVSHFRLAAHLGLAFLIFGTLIWTARDIAGGVKISASWLLTYQSWGTLYLLGVTVIWGAYVAGMDAGMVYNEFPLMGGQVLPPDAIHLTPLWVNFFENPVGIQFLHRCLGILSFLAVMGLYAHHRARKDKFPEMPLLPILVLVQASLGISTLLTQVWLPLAVLHQAGAFLLIGTFVSYLQRLK